MVGHYSFILFFRAKFFGKQPLKCLPLPTLPVISYSVLAFNTPKKLLPAGFDDSFVMANRCFSGHNLFDISWHLIQLNTSCFFMCSILLASFSKNLWVYFELFFLCLFCGLLLLIFSHHSSAGSIYIHQNLSFCNFTLGDTNKLMISGNYMPTPCFRYHLLLPEVLYFPKIFKFKVFLNLRLISLFFHGHPHWFIPQTSQTQYVQS